MKRGIYYILFFVLTLSGLYSCKPKESKVEITAGDMDASRYVAIGGTITAGFMDDALYEEGQENSLGAILAGQFKLVGGEDFTQPLMPGNSVGYDGYGLSRLILGYKTDCESVTSLSPLRIAGSGDQTGFETNLYNSGNLFNNFGIPYLKSTEFNVPGIGDPSNGPGNFNPFFTRMASNPVSTTVKADILASNPTFFTLFTGMDEVLVYAQGGAATGSRVPANGSAGVGFNGRVDVLLLELKAGTEQG